MNASPLLQARGVTVRFPGVVALDGVDFSIDRGEVHALMGENGAGKSTLVKVVTGVYRRDAGELTFDGSPLSVSSPQEAKARGISTIYQEVHLIPHLSLAENVCLGRLPMRRGRLNRAEMSRRARRSLARFGIDVDVSLPLGGFPVAVQQMAAIARAVDVDASLIILDEPTSSLTEAEVAELFRVVGRLRDEGRAVLFITHFIGQVYRVADRITVLRNGRLVGTFDAGALPRTELIAHMLGRSVKDVSSMEQASRRARPEGDAATGAEKPSAPVLRARGYGRPPALAPTDLEICEGEVVGLAGLLGSGRTELARLLFGADRATLGSVEVGGRRASLASPRAAIACGLGFCPEDRRRDGLVPGLSLAENVILAARGRLGRFGRVPGKRRREIARRYIAALGIVTTGPAQPVDTLSGGNQQKAILARWLALDPRVLILDEPTRGIDVGAKAEIEALVARLAERGMAVLFISSELDEVVRDCARVVVMRDRRAVGELAGPEADVPRIMRMIAGGHVEQAQ